MTVMHGHGRNRYACDLCLKAVITEARDVGTTPFMMACRATVACVGTMRSECYRGDFVNNGEAPAFIWRKPTREEYLRSSRAMKEHFDKGGLDIYPASERPATGNQQP